MREFMDEDSGTFRTQADRFMSMDDSCNLEQSGMSSRAVLQSARRRYNIFRA